MATGPEIVPEMEPTDQPNGECDLLNLRPLHLSAALKYIARTIQKAAAVDLLLEVLIRKETTVQVRRELRQMFPEYECHIAAGSHVDVGNNEND